MPEAYIYSAARTPIGLFQGGLSAIPATRLGAIAIQECLRRAAGVAPSVEAVVMGQALQAGSKQAPARQAALGAGLSDAVQCATVNKVCGSGMQAIIWAAQAIAAGEYETVVGGGMESMSLAPFLLPNARTGFRYGNQTMIDSIPEDGLCDAYSGEAMGTCAEAGASKFGIGREEQDAYAAESFRRANAAQRDGSAAAEIVPVEYTNNKGANLRIALDEVPGKVDYGKIPLLRPAFGKEGTITAANASGLNDGAAAALLGSAELGARILAQPMARIISWGSHSGEPLWFTIAPVPAAHKALIRAGWSVSDVDLWEVNEAFAVVPIIFARQMNIPHDRLNIRGGAISLGHPIGASGARIIVTLVEALRSTGKRRGVAAICIGGGEGLAMCIELTDPS